MILNLRYGSYCQHTQYGRCLIRQFELNPCQNPALPSDATATPLLSHLNGVM